MNKISTLLGDGIDGISMFILIAVICGAILVIGLGIWGTLLQWSVFFRYTANNRRHIGDKNAKQVAEDMLAKLGYTDIAVRKTSWLWHIFFYKWGNRYSPHRKTIFLYGNIIKKNTVTAIAIATQKVGLVIQHKRGDKGMVFRAKWELWTRLAPNMFLPITTFFVAIDVAMHYANLADPTFGLITLIGVGIAIVYTLFAFVALYLIIPTERKAGQLAMESIKKYNLVPSEYYDKIEGLYRVQVRVYIADFVLAVVNLILDIVYFFVKNAKYFNKMGGRR